MKIATRIARILLGLLFLLSGLNGFFNFLPQGPAPTGLAGQFFTVMMASHYLIAVFAIQAASGALFLINRYVALGLTLIAPVIVNILLFHLLMAPSTIPPGIVVTVLWLVVAYRERSAFTGIFRKNSAA